MITFVLGIVAGLVVAAIAGVVAWFKFSYDLWRSS